MKRYSLIIRVIAAILLLPVAAMADPDRYLGDSAIYTGDATYVRPNILIIFDNNSTMGNGAAAVDPYNPATTYAGSYSPWTVYKVTGMSNYVAHIANATSALTNVSCAAAKTSLQTVGTYSGSGSSSLKGDGTCGNGGAGLVYLGNLLNYNESATASATDAQVRILRNAVATIVNQTKGIMNFGLMTFGENKSGGRIVKPVADISSSASYNDFISFLPGTGSTGVGTAPPAGTYVEGGGNSVGLLSGNGRPLAEALYDAGAYYKGVYPIIYNQGSFASPIAYTCQKNYVIVLTNGDTDLDNSPKLGQTTALGMVGDYDADGLEPGAYGTGTHYLDDVAKFIYENDINSLAGTQRVVTHAVQIFSPTKVLVQRATNGSHGRGSYYVASDAAALATALNNIITSIVLETDTSFVAPVVPVSPENRTYSGSRVYLGFFKPQSGKPWLGNVKKYGINSNNDVVDKNGNAATNLDGSFKTTAVSYWSSSSDGGTVESGGTGQLLQTRTTARSIYTYTGTSTSLTNSTNALTTGNAAITATTLDVADATEKNKLIGFVQGTDTYDDDGDANVTEKRDWMLGDILHSKPLIVNYTAYDFTSANEADCNVNRALIYVGANDGMLHAFRDCDGQEEWAFIPPDSLPRLKYMRDPNHSYFVDSSPVAYIYDADKDGNIEAGDKVIIVFGQRRGGGSDSSPTGGFYYALDVSDPAAPVYMWKLGNTYSPSGTHTDYSEMGETWSEPTIVKMKIGTVDKMVAFVGAGYDNLNEDSRYGATQTFTGTGTVTSTDLGNGAVTSTGTSAASNPKGRGVYAIEIVELSSTGVPSFTHSGHKVWGYTNATNAALTFSFASEVSAMDFDYNGYVDRIYIPDTGGNLWKLSVGDTNTSNWTAFKLFASNPGSGGASDKGRKMFFRPSVVREASYTMLYLGSGDREHPLNRNVVDRIYAIKDNAPSSTITEGGLADVTLDTLQTGDASDISSALSALSSSSGWYIKLDQNSGEKVVAKSLVFSKAAHYTTHTPNAAPSADPCQPGNLGTGRIYVVDYLTGESVVNYDTGNDGNSTTNSRATAIEGQVLERSDRVKTLGSGMPSGVVAIISASGESAIMVGIGGGLAMPETKSDTAVVRIYWRDK